MYVHWDTVDLFPLQTHEIKEKRKAGRLKMVNIQDFFFFFLSEQCILFYQNTFSFSLRMVSNAYLLEEILEVVCPLGFAFTVQCWRCVIFLRDQMQSSHRVVLVQRRLTLCELNRCDTHGPYGTEVIIPTCPIHRRYLYGTDLMRTLPVWNRFDENATCMEQI